MAVAAPTRRPARDARPVAPRGQRRISGPLARPRPVPAPSPRTAERLRALRHHRVLDRLLRGRVWIWLIGLALGGIVAMQVSLLKLNAGISRAVQASSTLERQNSELEASIARLSSPERIRAAAEKRGMVAPPAGDLHYLRVRPGTDAGRAAARMKPPSEAARELMANGGRVPGALAAAPLPGAQPAASSQTLEPASAAPAPGTTAAPAPASSTAPPTATAPAPGTATAPAVTPGPGPTDTAAAPAPATGPRG
jgi:cell division protein FtsL